MDISHHKLTNTSLWDPYGLATMEEHLIQDQTPFHHHHHHHHHAQWPFYPQIIEPTSSGCSQLIASTNLLGLVDHQTGDLREENPSVVDQEEEPEEELGAMKEMMFKIAAMQPIDIDPATIRRPRRRNVRISDDPQSVAARHRRERISEKVRILQRLVPGGTKMDTASMLDEAIRYVKFLKRQIRLLQGNGNHHPHPHQHQPPCIGMANANPADDWVAVAVADKSYFHGVQKILNGACAET